MLGNPGILSDVYDESQPTGVRWDGDVEFPADGAFSTRPRLDPDGQGGYQFRQKAYLGAMTREALRVATQYTLGAYSNIVPVTDPQSGETARIISSDMAWIFRAPLGQFLQPVRY